MSRLRVLNVYSADGVLNQRTAHVPVKGLTLRVQTDREGRGLMQETLIIVFLFACVYPRRSAADVLLMQCQSSDCTLLHVVCCDDAHHNGKGKGEDFLNAFH